MDVMIHTFKVVTSSEKVVGRGLHVEEPRERRSAHEQDGCLCGILAGLPRRTAPLLA